MRSCRGVKLVAEDAVAVAVAIAVLLLAHEGIPRATDYEILNMNRRGGMLTNKCWVSTLGLRLLTIVILNSPCQA